MVIGTALHILEDWEGAAIMELGTKHVTEKTARKDCAILYVSGTLSMSSGIFRDGTFLALVTGEKQQCS